MKLPVMVRVLLSWLAEGGDRLQKPDVGVQAAIPLIFRGRESLDRSLS